MSQNENAPAPEQTPEQNKGKKKHPLRVLALFVLLLCLGAGFFGWKEVQNFLNTTPEVPGQSVVIDIEPGMTLAQVASKLAIYPRVL